MRAQLLLCILISPVLCLAQEPPPQAAESVSSIPRTVDEAVAVLKARWLSAEDRDWILGNSKEDVVSTLHLPFGTGVRNEFKLWRGNPELLASCGTNHAEECSSIIFERLWESIRQDADPRLVRKLDCQFQLTEEIRIEYKGFYALKMGEMLQSIQQQIDRQLPDQASALRDGCETSLQLQPTGDPDLGCWVRVEFSEDGEGPVSLSLILGWISWRNDFEVLHSPPQIELRYSDKCAWPEKPVYFQPENPKR